MFLFKLITFLAITSLHILDTSLAQKKPQQPSKLSNNTKSSDNTHPCLRPCPRKGQKRKCKYEFVVEWHRTMSTACKACPYVMEDCHGLDCIAGDGSARELVVINRRLPGTSIEVCFEDEVIVDVRNNLIDMASTTIHWHGHTQKGTPYMDGVPFITQCPIEFGTTFRYQFPANVKGTHWWHSHTGMQRADGAFGAFIIRIPEYINPHKKLYDYDLSEHVMVITDWMEQTGMEKFMGHYHSSGNVQPSSILINGKGKYAEFKPKENNKKNQKLHTPLSKFVVKKGYKYRFRVINASFLNCPIEMWIDKHAISIISSDGHDVKPQKVHSLVMYAGERFDFVLEADKKDDSYWMRLKGLMDCDEKFGGAFQVAILQYEKSKNKVPDGTPTHKNSKPTGSIQLNSLNKGMESKTTISIPNLKSTAPYDKSLQKKPDFKHFISYDFYEKNNTNFNMRGVGQDRKGQKRLTPQLNHISMKVPSIPILQGRKQLDENSFCNESTVTDCEKKYCQCTHVLQVPLGKVVEVIIIDEGLAFDANHPFHLHGTPFRVIGMERVGKDVTLKRIQDMDKKGALKRNLNSPPWKDTVTVPDGGYTILRFVADNPGYWLFHCHIVFHRLIGMGLVFKFGEDDQMPAVPKKFPTCGDYLGS